MDVLRKMRHLQPARPLRRCLHDDVGFLTEPTLNAVPSAQSLMDLKTNIDIELFCKLVNFQTDKKERLSYTREFLIGLASCPAAKKRPAYLPDHPIVLASARESPMNTRKEQEVSHDPNEDKAVRKMR